jgi:ABC-2 type transport system ATP-binding protein
MGLIHADAGMALLDGRNLLTDLAPKGRERIGYAPQEEALFPTLTVEENLRLYAELTGLRGAEVSARVREVAEAFLVGDLLPRVVSQLSGGQRRRVHNAIALVGRPGLVILDEPTAGVDPATRSAILDVVRRLAASGTAVCYSTHYLAEVTALGAEVTLLDRGRVIACGTAERLIATHATPAIELTFAGEPPAIDGFPGRAHAVGNVLRVEVHNPAAQLAAVIATLGPEHGTRITNVELIRPDLESVFLMLTGRRFETGPTP